MAKLEDISLKDLGLNKSLKSLTNENDILPSFSSTRRSEKMNVYAEEQKIMPERIMSRKINYYDSERNMNYPKNRLLPYIKLLADEKASFYQQSIN